MDPSPDPFPSDRTAAFTARWSAGSGWRIILAATAGSALLTACFFSPRFWLWPVAGLPLGEFVALQPEFHRAFHALQQLADPWQRIDDAVNRVIEWRLLWPVLGHAFGLPPSVYLALPHLGCLAALGAATGLAWRSTRDAVPTAAVALLVASCSWFFVSTGWLAYFDSWLLLALLLASFGRARWLLFTAALIAPWIDERFILALPLCLAVRALGTDRDSAPDRAALVRDGLALFGGVLPYAATRLGCEFSGARATSTSYWTGRPLLPAPAHVMLWGAWNGLRLGWIALALAAASLIKLPGRRLPLAIGGVTFLLNLFVADDVSRSASVAVPALVAALLLLWRDDQGRMRQLLPLLCAGNLLLPAQHIIAAPGTPAAWHSVPVLSLTAEWERVRHPPDFANPDTYHRRSLDHFQNGNHARALAACEIGLRFDPGHAKSIANHGILLYVGGDRKQGLAELDRALALAPHLYDARMQRAAFRQQASDPAGALEDVRAALRFIPADWPRRPDALQFERSLATQLGR